ncbi:MAG: carboxypeptidase regulatory-like domain-containing protein [Deltaproteobacteria bacterium]|nr:carboxypeptidase regulatory-like domain-containing protein [Deltaproteobacteria bacterium]
MKRALIVNCSLALCVLLTATATTACAGSIITLRIVDAESGQPIKEAIIAYRWYKVKIDVPGLPTKAITIDAGEDTSDLNGTVKMPKHSMLVNNLRMVVYKKGYVCWSNRHEFPGWMERKDFELNDGMVIRMERFKEVYSAKDHAWFTKSMSTGLPQGPRLGDALTEETKLLLNR